MGRLDDGNNEFAYEALHLADCFGPNNEADSGMIRWYPYIAQQLIRYSEKNVAALQKRPFCCGIMIGLTSACRLSIKRLRSRRISIKSSFLPVTY